MRIIEMTNISVHFMVSWVVFQSILIPLQNFMMLDIIISVYKGEKNDLALVICQG